MPTETVTWWKPWKHRLFWDAGAIFFMFGIAIPAGFAPSAEMTPDEPDAKPRQRASAWVIVCTAGAGVFGVASRIRDWMDKRGDADKLKRATVELRSATRKMVVQVLETARRDFFAEDEEAEIHKLRATLFRVVANAPSGTKGLQVYARARSNPDSTRRWAVVDENPRLCQGVAGYIWAIGTARIILPPCEWVAASTADERVAYATATFLSVEEVDSLAIKSSGFGGTIVEVAGVKWGVLLMDAQEKGRLKKTIASTNAHTLILEKYAALLGRMIQEGEA